MSYPSEINDYADYYAKFVVKYKDNLSPYFTMSIPRGWRPLVESFMDSVTNTDFKAVQIKEKFGTLRIYKGYDSGKVPVEYADTINKASHTCAICGEEGTLRTLGGHAVLCDKHYAEITKTRN